MARDGLLEGKIALITAGASGMGRAAALLFAREGATVVVADIDGERAEAVAGEVRSAGGSAESFAVDVTDLDRLKALFTFAGERFGKLDVLYNHAGLPGPAGLDVSDTDWQRTIDVNMRAGFYACGYARPLLVAAGGGSIIFTSSISGIVGSPLSPLYSMAKGGIVLLVKSLALSLAADGIRVNAICPGSVDTPMLPQFFGKLPEEEARRVREAYIGSIPLGRIAQPEEIASTALFLASSLSSFVTGVSLPVDGGYSAR
jgi:NAD(P)-dependent dehydrogenase (short-subunit alcohol dehydrogenase family)